MLHLRCRPHLQSVNAPIDLDKMLTGATGGTPYGRPPGFGAFPGQPGGPPAMAGPPGMGALSIVSIMNSNLIVNRAPWDVRTRCGSSTWHATEQCPATGPPWRISSQLPTSCKYAQHQLLRSSHTIRHYRTYETIYAYGRRYGKKG